MMKSKFDWNGEIDMINLDGKNKEQICQAFVEVCKNGTSRDCSRFVHEAKRNGVSYEELCEYKRNMNK